MTGNFLRQRRNLFIINGILLFSCLAKVNISKLTVAGLSFESFNNPSIIYLFLWFIWIYFLYRYSIFFIEEEYKSLTKFWKREINRYTTEKLSHIAETSCQHDYLANGCDYYSMKRKEWTLYFQESYDDGCQGQKVINRKISITLSDMAFPMLKGFTRFCIATPAVTNYLFPFLLNIFVLWISISTSWEGAPMKQILMLIE